MKKGGQNCGALIASELKRVAMLLRAGCCATVALAVFSWVLLSRGYLSLHARAGICRELHCASMAPPGTEGADVLHRD